LFVSQIESPIIAHIINEMTKLLSIDRKVNKCGHQNKAREDHSSLPRKRLRGGVSLRIFLLLGVMQMSTAWVGQKSIMHRIRPMQNQRKRISTAMATDSRELRFLHGPSSTLQNHLHELSHNSFPQGYGATSLQNNYPHELRHNTVWVSGQRASVMPASATESILSLVGGGVGSIGSKGKRAFSSTTGEDSPTGLFGKQQPKPKQGYGGSFQLTDEERELFNLLRRVRNDTGISTTLRVAGGFVRDRLLATPEFNAHQPFEEKERQGRLTSKFQKSASMGRQGTKVLTSGDHLPVDIDIALDNMLGREFADHLNKYLTSMGEKTVSVGVVMKNPEKSKHLETATMKVDTFWIDFVNLRAEEYTQDSRIPDLMRIGTASEDAFRRDLTINSLFYNINTGEVEDWTGRGFDDLRKGIIATPLAPLTTLLDDPLRVLRSVRFAARLRFKMDDELITAAKDERVRTALGQKVSRERVGGEVDLMLRSPDPVGAMRLLINLKLIDTVFPVSTVIYNKHQTPIIFSEGLALLSTTHDYLVDCRLSPPLWCQKKRTAYGTVELRLTEDEQARRFLWYASFLKPLWDYSKHKSQSIASKRDGKKGSRSEVGRVLVDELKRPIRDAESIEKIMKAADDFTQLMDAGCDISATMILLSDVRITHHAVDGADDDDAVDGTVDDTLVCSMQGRPVDSVTEEDPVWELAMEFRLLCSKVLQRVGPLWRAALFLSTAEQLASLEDGLEYSIEGDTVDESRGERRRGVIERFDVFAAALQQTSLIGIWNGKPLLDGERIKKVLPRIPKGPAFREVMDEQVNWMTTHPGAEADTLSSHLRECFPDYAAEAVASGMSR
jgi:tRNA nucleotidyltransferase/poly(A) polymerase